jgi:hypothetical protein
MGVRILQVSWGGADEKRGYGGAGFGRGFQLTWRRFMLVVGGHEPLTRIPSRPLTPRMQCPLRRPWHPELRQTAMVALPCVAWTAI